MDFGVSVINPGDLLVMPVNGSNIQWPPREVVEVVATPEFKLIPWLSTISSETCAGFYGVSRNGSSGVLPFVFGPVPPEKYCVFRFTQRFVFPTPDYFVGTICDPNHQ